MKISKNGDQGSLARLADLAPGQVPVQNEYDGALDDEKGYLPVVRGATGSLEDKRIVSLRDNKCLKDCLISVGNDLRYDCFAQVEESAPGVNSHYSVYFSKETKSGPLVIKYDIPIYGRVTGTIKKAPADMLPNVQIALLRDLMRLAVHTGKMRALPMKQSINLAPLVVPEPVPPVRR